MKYLIAAIFMAVAPLLAHAEGKSHKVAINVDENDPQVMNMALNNVSNVISYYESVGDTVEVEVVTYGPGLNMLVAGKSPVEDRVSVMALERSNVTFSACGNTHRAMEEKAGKQVPLLSEAKVVPSGVVRLIELQEDGYAYVRP